MVTRRLQRSRLLICSSSDEIRFTLNDVLQHAGLPTKTFGNVGDLAECLERNIPDLVLFDLTSFPGERPDLLVDMLKRYAHCGFVVLISEDDVDTAKKVAELGAYDFLTTPIDIDQIAIRMKVAISRHDRTVGDRMFQQALEGRLHQRTEEALVSREKIQQQIVNTIRALEKALQAKHVYTEGHSRRVADKTVEIATEMGVNGEELRNIELAALFHDIGKIGIRDEVLNKAGKLTDSEYEHVKMHPIIGEQILSQIEDLAPIVPMVKHEHERWDGDGYPDGLRAEQIPFGARIIAIADAWDSMVYDRIYRRGASIEDVLKELRDCAGTQFDPKCVDAHERLERRKLKEGQESGT